MVEYTYQLDFIFGALSDPTRRDILARIRERSLNISEVAKNYTISFAGVAKHIEVLVRAGLIRKDKRGKEQIVSIDPVALAAVDTFLAEYRKLWEQRLDNLGSLLDDRHKTQA